MKNIRLLIVEDDPSYQLSLEILLQKLGYEFCAAKSGEAALQLAQRTAFDLGLLDIHLAGEMTGIDLAAELKKRFDMPVVFLTGSDDPFTYAQARDAAEVVYLVKPVNQFTLRSVIEIALQGKNSSVPVSKSLSGFLYLKHKGRSIRIATNEIIYVEADGNYCYIYAVGQRRFIVKTSLRKVSEKLSNPPFVQIHRSCIVHADFIRSFDLATGKVQLEHEELPVGASFKNNLIQRLHRI